MATSDPTRKTARKHEFFKEEFDRLAVGGLIGHPNGKPAYAYLRVSSDEQSDEGRSGLPRQIEHVHQKALEAGYCISWDRVFADDFSGFELERPALNEFRREYQSSHRSAHAVVIEHLDRLSRNSDWHQGYLLSDLRDSGIEAIFWKSFSSRIERVVMGAVSQDAMELAKQRMQDGVRKKAESGRITARRPAYGCKFVDGRGNEGADARKDTHYALIPEQVPIIQLIYKRVASGESLHKIADDLNLAGIPTPTQMGKWTRETLRNIVRNPIYKGEYIANRWIAERKAVTDANGVPKMRERRYQRPESEWIRVSTSTAIVDVGLWQAANDILAKNKQMASRNGKHQYLLTGLLKCATCGRSYNGKTFEGRNGKMFKAPCVEYRCARLFSKETSGTCDQACILAETIEEAVWGVVCDALLSPNVLIKALEREMFDEQNALIEQQIAYLQAEIGGKQTEDDKLYKAYIAGVFDETEYAERRKLLKAESVKLHDELAKLLPRRVSREDFEKQRAIILKTAEEIRKMNAHIDPPFELKQRILKMLVDRIVLNTHTRTFTLEGRMCGQYSIVNLPDRRDIHNFQFSIEYSLFQSRIVSISIRANSHAVETEGLR